MAMWLSIRFEIEWSLVLGSQEALIICVLGQDTLPSD